MALSPNYHWTTLNATMQILKMINRAMILAFFQGYLVPPHCKAKRRQTIAGTNRIVSIGSNCKKRRLDPIENLGARGGALKKKRLTPTTTAPTMTTRVSFKNTFPGHDLGRSSAFSKLPWFSGDVERVELYSQSRLIWKHHRQVTCGYTQLVAGGVVDYVLL